MTRELEILKGAQASAEYTATSTSSEPNLALVAAQTADAAAGPNISHIAAGNPLHVHEHKY